VQIPHDPFVNLGDAWAAGFAPVIPLLLESVALWNGIEAELGVDLEVEMKGGILVAGTNREMRDIERKARLERSMGVEVEILSARDLQDRAPYLSKSLVGGAYCATEGKANPLVCAPAFAAASRELGVEFRTWTRVVDLEKEQSGYRITTDRGDFRARRVINAAGASADRISEMLGLAVEVQSFPIQLSVTVPTEPLVHNLVYAAAEKLTLKQTRNGSIIIGGGWPAFLDAQGRPVCNIDHLARNIALAIDVVPGLAEVELLRTWAAFVNGNASWRPIIGEAEGRPGFYLAYVPWIGFTASLATAFAVADMALGRKPESNADLAQFAPRASNAAT
jgi:glycine/D-amino acid oxidase-like deaminating enzyme